MKIQERVTSFTNIAIPTDEPDTDAESWKLSAESNSTGSEQRICYQSEAYRMLDEEIKGGTLQEINRK